MKNPFAKKSAAPKANSKAKSSVKATAVKSATPKVASKGISKAKVAMPATKSKKFY